MSRIADHDLFIRAGDDEATLALARQMCEADCCYGEKCRDCICGAAFVPDARHKLGKKCDCQACAQRPNIPPLVRNPPGSKSSYSG